MFIVTKKPLTPNILWDEKSGSVLCKFINGKLETDDEKLASKLEKLGYQIEEVKEPETPKTPEKSEEPDEGSNGSEGDGNDADGSEDLDGETDDSKGDGSEEPETPKTPEKSEEPDEGKSSEGEKPKTRRSRK